MTSRRPLLHLAAGIARAPNDRRGRGLLERLAAATLETLLNAIDANDADTGRHVRRVASFALIIADGIGLDLAGCRAVERVAVFHDIGKIHEALFDIVHDGTRLTAADRRAIDTHPARGAQVLAPLKSFYPELPAGVLAHHEWWNGTGYPRNLEGSRIPLEARIVAVADTFDAVAHSRRYRTGTGAKAALDVLAEGRGTQFDPAIIDLVLLPPISKRLAKQHLVGRTRHRHVAARPSQGSDKAPDVSFRWRSESLGSSRVGATRNLD
jgi:HD-GYP domain-containing protein (c-di-GMP phosphodiesterase class II)